MSKRKKDGKIKYIIVLDLVKPLILALDINTPFGYSPGLMDLGNNNIKKKIKAWRIA